MWCAADYHIYMRRNSHKRDRKSLDLNVNEAHIGNISILHEVARNVT